MNRWLENKADCSVLYLTLSLSFPTSSNSKHLLDDYNVSHLHVIIPLSKREREFSGLYTVNLNIRLLFFLFSHSSVDIFRKNLRIKSAGRLYTFCYLLYHQNRCIYFALSNQASSSIDCIFLVSLTSIFCRWIDLEEDDIRVGDGRSGSSQFYF